MIAAIEYGLIIGLLTLACATHLLNTGGKPPHRTPDARPVAVVACARA